MEATQWALGAETGLLRQNEHLRTHKELVIDLDQAPLNRGTERNVIISEGKLAEQLGRSHGC